MKRQMTVLTAGAKALVSEQGALAALRIALVGTVLLTACAATRTAETDRIAGVLRLERGMSVADVGAGDGEFSVELAHHVGDGGRVFATEVDDEELEKIRARVRSEDLSNVTVVRGDQETIGLEEGCCDAILLRLVYHHFTEPDRMRADLRRALRANALLAVVDITPQKNWRELPGVPDRGGHGIGPDGLIAEMVADGFEVVEQVDEWNGDEDRFCVVFRRAAEPESVH